MASDLMELAARLFRRRRSPNWATLGMSYEDAFRIMGRKSLWMVEYLRGRRSGDHLTGFYRRQHLAEAAALRTLANGEPSQ